MLEELKIIIDNAIKEEEYFILFYKKLAEIATNSEVKKRLSKLSDQEGVHKERLQSLNLRSMEGKIISGIITKEDIEFEVSLTPLEEFSGMRDMLAFAIKQEALAQLTYEKMSAAVNDYEIKSMFNLLASEEKKHKLLLTGEIALLNKN